MVLAEIPGMLPAHTRHAQWMDDLLNLSPSREEANEASAALHAALKSGRLHGRFEVKQPVLEVVDARRGFEFCGLYFYMSDGRFHARPASDRLKVREAAIKAQALLGMLLPDWRARAERTMDAFLHHYPFWSHAGIWRERMMRDIEAARITAAMLPAREAEAKQPRCSRPRRRDGSLSEAADGTSPALRRRVPKGARRALSTLAPVITTARNGALFDSPGRGWRLSEAKREVDEWAMEYRRRIVAEQAA